MGSIFARSIQGAVLHTVLKLSISIKLNGLLIIANTDIALFTALLHCLIHFKYLLIHLVIHVTPFFTVCRLILYDYVYLVSFYFEFFSVLNTLNYRFLMLNIMLFSCQPEREVPLDPYMVLGIRPARG